MCNARSSNSVFVPSSCRDYLFACVCGLILDRVEGQGWGGNRGRYNASFKLSETAYIRIFSSIIPLIILHARRGSYNASTSSVKPVL
ncbi:hypothetical protein SCA6_017059 [Theobroma cacao]